METYEPKEIQIIEADRQVRTARFSPCGRYLLAGGYDAMIRRWDFSEETPRPLEPLTGHHGWVESLVLHPQSDRLFSTDSWGQLCARPYADPSPRPAWQHDQAHDGWIRSLAISADARLLATGGRDRMVRVWSSDDGRLLYELAGHEEEVYCVAIHPDGRSVVSGDLKGNLKHWDLATGSCRREVRLDSMYFYERIQDVAGLWILQFRDDGETLVCAGAEPTDTGQAFGVPTIQLLNWGTMQTEKTLQLGPSKDGFIFDLHWHPDGFFMAVTSGTPGAGRVFFQRPGDEKPLWENTKMSNTHSLAVHLPTGRFVVSATNRNSQGNGAVRDKEGNYLGNSSPLHVFQLPEV